VIVLLKAGSVLKRSFHLSSFLFKLLLLLSSARFIYLNSAPLIEKNLNTEYTTQQSETALTTLLTVVASGCSTLANDRLPDILILTSRGRQSTLAE